MLPFLRAAEDQAAGGRHHARPRRREQLALPLHSPVLASSARTAPEAWSPRSARSPPPVKGCPLVLRLALEVVGAHLAHRHVEEFVCGLYDGLNQLVAPWRLGHTSVPSSEGSVFGSTIGPALGVDAVGPGLLRVRARVQELAGLAIEHVVEARCGWRSRASARPAADRRVEQHLDLIGVPVVDVVRRVLEVPLHLAGRRRRARAPTQV